MEGYQTVRCLFCVTGKEESVVEAVHRNGWGRAVFPQQAGNLRVNRQWIDVFKPLLPGYVFVYCGQKPARQDELARISHVLRVLSYGTGQDALTGRDLEFADWIWRQDGMIGSMKALQIGDWIEITDGVFKQLHGTIIRMDRRRRIFLVSLDGAGAIQRIWLTYEVVEKRDADKLIPQ